jgi:hypothetical protein
MAGHDAFRSSSTPPAKNIKNYMLSLVRNAISVWRAPLIKARCILLCAIRDSLDPSIRDQVFNEVVTLIFLPSHEMCMV